MWYYKMKVCVDIATYVQTVYLSTLNVYVPLTPVIDKSRAFCVFRNILK